MSTKIYKKDYFGFVYLWYDTKHKKFIIGSHFGSLYDGYTTSTGGVHVKRIFKVRPETMKRRVLAFCHDNDKNKLKSLEQSYLDLRPNINSNQKYYNMSQYATGGVGGWDLVNSNPDRVNPMSTKVGRENHLKRMKELSESNKYHFGTHFLDNNPMKCPLVAKMNGQNSVGTVNASWQGFWKTPYGIFTAISDASEVEEFTSCGSHLKTVISERCKRSNKRKLSKKSLKYVDISEDDIGKTWNDLGYFFIRKSDLIPFKAVSDD